MPGAEWAEGTTGRANDSGCVSAKRLSTPAQHIERSRRSECVRLPVIELVAFSVLLRDRLPWQVNGVGGPDMNLKNATVLITGGSGGIGRAIAASLIGAGARVAITGRHEDKLAEAAASLGAHPIRADVTSESDVMRTYEDVLSTFGHLDVLVNNAGFGTFKPLVDIDRDSFNAVFAINVTGAMLMAREAAKHFIRRNREETRRQPAQERDGGGAGGARHGLRARGDEPGPRSRAGRAPEDALS